MKSSLINKMPKIESSLSHAFMYCVGLHHSSRIEEALTSNPATFFHPSRYSRIGRNSPSLENPAERIALMFV